MSKNMYDINMQWVPSVFTFKDLTGFCFRFLSFCLFVFKGGKHPGLEK